MSLNLFKLDGRTALVTGSGQGIGLAVAEGLAAAGAHVVLNGRDAGKLEKARSAIATAGRKASIVSGFASASSRSPRWRCPQHSPGDPAPVSTRGAAAARCGRCARRPAERATRSRALRRPACA